MVLLHRASIIHVHVHVGDVCLRQCTQNIGMYVREFPAATCCDQVVLWWGNFTLALTSRTLN